MVPPSGFITQRFICRWATTDGRLMRRFFFGDRRKDVNTPLCGEEEYRCNYVVTQWLWYRSRTVARHRPSDRSSNALVPISSLYHMAVVCRWHAGTGVKLMGCKSPDPNRPFGGLAGGRVCGVIRRLK